MKLNRVKIRGFGSFADEHEFLFRDGVTYIIGRNLDRPEVADSNGAGKTTIFDATSWALYGRTPSGRKSDSIINHNRNKVIVELIGDGLHIVRSKKRTRGEILKWHTGDGSWKRGDLIPTQESLTSHIGISFNTFCNTLYLTRASKTVAFLEATPANRAKVLAELVDDSLFQKAADNIWQDVKIKEDEVTRDVFLLHELRKQRDQLVKDSINISNQLKQFTEEDNIRRNRVQRKIQSLKERAEKEHAKLEDPPTANMQELQNNKVGIKKQIEDDKKRVAVLKHMLTQADGSLDEGTTCPSCRQIITEDAAVELHEFKEIAREEVDNLEESIQTLALTLKDIEEEQDKLRQWRFIQTQVAENLDNIRIETQMLKDDLLPADTTHLKDLLDENKKRQKELEERSQQLKQTISGITKDLPYMKDLKKAFGSEIRNMMFDRIRGALEHYTNLYLKLLAGDEFEISFPTQSHTGRERFEIILRSGRKEQSLESYSEGERWRATFAILIALRRVLLEGNHCNAEWLMVDDPIGALDETGTNAFNKVLRGLAGRGGIPQVLCTVPRVRSWPDAARVVTITRKNRISGIDE